MGKPPCFPTHAPPPNHGAMPTLNGVHAWEYTPSWMYSTTPPHKSLCPCSPSLLPHTCTPLTNLPHLPYTYPLACTHCVFSSPLPNTSATINCIQVTLYPCMCLITCGQTPLLPHTCTTTQSWCHAYLEWCPCMGVHPIMDVLNNTPTQIPMPLLSFTSPTYMYPPH